MATASPSAASSPRFTPDVRIQRNPLARIERRVLIWIARRLPAWIHPDHLTLLALVAMAGVGAGYWLAHASAWGLLIASAGLMVNWFGDSLDGTVARVRDCQRPRYGYYVDHVLDVVGVTWLFGGLMLSGLIHPGIAVAALVTYLLVSIEVYLATHSLGEFHMSAFGIGPTELRLLLIAGNTALFLRPTHDIAGTGLTPFDIAGLIATAALALVFVTSVVRHTRRLHRAGQ